MKCRCCNYELPHHRTLCRLDEICRELYAEIFATLDAELEIPGELAGQAAWLAESEIRKAIDA